MQVYGPGGKLGAVLIWLFLLLLLAVALEHRSKRPFLATLGGRGLALLLSAERLTEHRYEVVDLPAIGFRAAAQTWGETVLVTRALMASPNARTTLAHEAVHVRQYRELTSFGFWLAYLRGYVSGLWRYRNAFSAYWEIPLEVAARREADASDGAPSLRQG